MAVNWPISDTHSSAPPGGATVECYISKHAQIRIHGPSEVTHIRCTDQNESWYTTEHTIDLLLYVNFHHDRWKGTWIWEPKISKFGHTWSLVRPQGRHDAPIQAKFSTEEHNTGHSFTSNLPLIGEGSGHGNQSRQWVDGSWVNGSNGSLLGWVTWVSVRWPMTHVGIFVYTV